MREANKITLRGVKVRQQGYTIMLMLFLLSAGAGAMVLNYFRPSTLTINNDKATAAALAQAREALIGYAASNPNQPGVLPCPDTNNDGSANSPCGATGVTAAGRLPWKTLGLPDLRDGAGECLWYAVSGNFKNSGVSGPSTVNSDSAGTLTVNTTGGTPVYAGSSAVAAVVFAPGNVLSGQDRSPLSATVCGGNSGIANYLENGNQLGAATSTFVTGQATTVFNDKLLPITTEAIFQVVEYRVAREIRARLAAYYATNGYYPYASNYGDAAFSCVPGLTRGRLPKPGGVLGSNIANGCNAPALANWSGTSAVPTWFTTNNWHLLTYYTIAPACIITTPGCTGAGLLAVNNLPAPNNNKQALVIVAGRALAGQARPCAGVADCLDDAENTNLDDVYTKNTLSAIFNDKIVIVAP